MLSVNNKYIDMSGISRRFTQGENNADVYKIHASRYDEAGTDLLALSWAMVGSHVDYSTLASSAVSVSEDKDGITFSWKVSSDFTACDGALDLCLQGSDSSGNVVIKYRSSGVRVATSLSGNLDIPQNVIEQALSQIALALPQCAAAIEAAKTATEKAATAVIASNTATQKATAATASEKAAATSATAAKASETTAAQKATAAAASATAAANSSTLATTKAAEAAASATAAQGYKVQTQQLRDEVHTIVAGNEAYTKQETRDKFSRALEVESPAAAAQVIAVEPQSDLRARYYGFTEQAGTGDPSPTNIRPITVGGNASNLIPFPYIDSNKSGAGMTYTVQPDGGIKCVGTATSTTFFSICGNLFVGKPIGNYFLSGGISSNVRVYVREAGPPVKYYEDNGMGISVPVKQGQEYECTLTVLNGTTVNTTIYPRLNAGDFAYPYTPYTGYDYAGLMSTQGANLIPFPYADGMSKTTNGVTFTVQSDGAILANGTATAASVFYLRKDFSLQDDCFLSGGKNFYFLLEAEKKTTPISYYTDVGNGVAFPKGEYRILYIVVRVNHTVNNELICPMLNIGTTSTPYEPYIPPTNYALPSPVSLPDGCSVKAGYVDADKMIVFDGSETNWQYTSAYSGISLLYKAFPQSTSVYLRCQYFYCKEKFTPSDGLSGYIVNATSNGEIAIAFDKNKFPDKQSCIDFLSNVNAKGAPLTIYYQSASYAGEKIPVWLVNVTKKKIMLKDATNCLVQTVGLQTKPVLIIKYLTATIYKFNTGITSQYRKLPSRILPMPNQTFYDIDSYFAAPAIYDERYTTFAEWNSALKTQYNAGTPVEMLFTLPTPETYAIPYTRCESSDTVNCTISTPEGTCSALYNADLKTYFDRLQSAIIALGGTI